MYCDKQRKMRYESTQLNRSVVSLPLSNEKYYRFKNTHSNNNNNNNNNNNINDRTAIFYYDIGLYFMLLKFCINISLVVLIISNIINIFACMLSIFLGSLMPNFPRKEYILIIIKKWEVDILFIKCHSLLES